MKEILVACGDVPLLKEILSHLPANTFKPIATKNGLGTAQKVVSRPLALAIVHLHLADQGASTLVRELRSLKPDLPILLLTPDTPPQEGPFDRSLRYPVPAPVLRNAIKSLAPPVTEHQDLDRWKTFYQEVKARYAQTPEQSYYGILGLPDGAPHHALVAAFDKLSMRYHPDKYSQFRQERWGKALFDKVNALYKLMTHAYGVVSDRRLRKVYDQALAQGQLRLAPEDTNMADRGPRSLDELANSPHAKKFLKLAQTEIAKGNQAAALQNLKFALSMEPDNLAIQKKITTFNA